MSESAREFSDPRPARSSTITRELADKVAKASTTARKANAARDVPSMARLRLSHMHLHGRDDDLKLLRSKLADLSRGGDGIDVEEKRRRPELVLISGASGVGKSSLVARGLRDPAKKRGVAFASGKFDLNKRALPLSAFANAMAVLTKLALEGGMMQQIKDGVRETFGEEDSTMLISALPGCAGLFAPHNGATGRNEQSTTFGKEATSRLQYAIRRLLKIICANLNGVVLFLDDLQWSDAATLDLLKNTSLDSNIPSLLIVGAYRDDEVPDSHPLALQIREKKRMGIAISTIRIGNLSARHVQSLVAEALGMEDDEDAVETLAEVVHKKTDGNPFFVLFFLRSLYEEELIRYNFGTMKWHWNDDEIRTKLMTENVANVLSNKLKRAKGMSQTVLKVASCLGSKFSVSIVATIVQSFSRTGADRDTDAMGDNSTISLSSSLSELEDEGLLEKDTDDNYCFTHDRIQSAAFELIPPEKRGKFRGEIGNILRTRLDPVAFETCVFLGVVSLLNCAADTASSNERIELAKMNLQAGLRASYNATFDTAAVYFKAGHELLGATGWVDDPAMMLKLCSEGANACFVSGDIEAMDRLIDEVLKQDLPICDKFRVYEVKLLSLQEAGEFDKSISLALRVRRELGLYAPPKNKPASTLTILKEYLKAARAFKDKSPEDVATLPEVKDEKIAMGQRMLELLCTSTYQAQPSLLPIIIFLLVRASLRFGINRSSCDAFSGLGLLLCGPFNKLQKGREMAKAVELLLTKPGMNLMKSRSIFVCHTFVYHWTAPLHDSIGPLLEGYQIGLETGDVESAGSNLTHRGIFLFYIARPLDALENELETEVTALAQLNLVPQRMNLCAVLMAVRRLRGVSTEEDCTDFHAIKKFADETGNQGLRANTLTLWLEVLVIEQEWDAAHTLLVEAGDLRPCLTAMYSMIRFTFLEALIYLKAAQSATQLKSRKWKRRSLKPMKLIRGWLKQGNVNVLHKIHLLEAEQAAMNRKTKKAEGLFKAAIKVASKNGFLQDRALAHELAGAYYSVQGDDYWSNYHLDCSKKCYLEWGANVTTAARNDQTLNPDPSRPGDSDNQR